MVRVGVLAVPNCGIVVACRRHHDHSVNSFNVEGRVQTHHSVEEGLLVEVFVTDFHESVLCGDSPLVFFGVRLVSVVVCLDEEPCAIAELIGCVDVIAVSLDDDSLVALNARHHEVDGSCNFGIF